MKIKNKNQSGIEIMNNNEQIKGLALDSVEHFDNNKLRLKGRSIPIMRFKFFSHKNLSANLQLTAMVCGNLV